ncbi:unnamed protein product, partial [Miscanthus lutarioriparius]
FIGMIPSSIGKLGNLHGLNLELNKLKARNSQDWEFIYSLGNCSKLQGLSVFDNQLEGHVPTSLGNLSVELQILLLGNNQLSGGFPSGIANLRNLMWLGLGGNQFTGKVPEWLGTLNSLQVMNLGNNNFTGFIPSSLSNLSQLLYLYLESNKFEGHLPASIGNLQNLQLCNFSNNLLHGGIPKEMFGIPAILHIDLSVNHLHGQLPYEVGYAKELIYLNLSSNMLFGDIPTNIGNCENLQYIGLQQNSFGGSIPVSLGNIRGLEVLDLSHNNLTGSIPMSLTNLQYLEQLDLSFNNISGQVPLKGIFSNVTAVRIDGNPGLCGGPLELHLLACHVMPANSSKQRHSIVQKVVIPLSCILSLAIVITVMVVWRGKQKTNLLSLPSFSSKFPKVSYNDLAGATCGFSSCNLIGKGRYSSMYKGELFQDKTMVAVKVFRLETWGAQKSFIAECNALRKVRHRNLVPILTACSSIDSNGNDFKALVYEFMTQECAAGGAVSSAGDVYSFGIVLLEIFLRRRPTDDMFNGEMNITKFVEMNFPDRIPQIIDPELLVEQQHLCPETSVAMKEKSLECLLSVLNIGLLCTKPSPNERICMQEVTARLHGIKKAYIS